MLCPGWEFELLAELCCGLQTILFPNWWFYCQSRPSSYRSRPSFVCVMPLHSPSYRAAGFFVVTRHFCNITEVVFWWVFFPGVLHERRFMSDQSISD